MRGFSIKLKNMRNKFLFKTHIRSAIFMVLLFPLGSNPLYAQSTVTNYVYRFDPNQVTTNTQGVATSIPTSVQGSLTSTLIYVRSLNTVTGSSNNIIYNEVFGGLSPTNGFNLNTYNVDSHYFAIVSEVGGSLNFITNLILNNDNVCCTRPDFTLVGFEKARITKLEDFSLPVSIKSGGSTYTNQMWVGISPPRPDSFSIQAKTNENNWVSTSKVTEGETIRFMLDGPSGYIWYNIEKSTDGGQTWSTVHNYVGSEATYTVDSYINLANHPTIPSVKQLLFRARTYSNANPVVGKSFGFIQLPALEVYPKPQFDVNQSFEVCYNKVLTEINITNIEVSQSIEELKILIKKVGTQNPVGTTLPKPFPSSFSFKKLSLAPGDYYITLENIFTTNNTPYPCGHTTKTFTVTAKTDLSTFLLNNIESIPCQGENNDINVLTGERFPTGVKAYYSTNLASDSVEFLYNEKIIFNYPSNQIKYRLFYTTGDACRVERTHNIVFNFPLLNPEPSIQYPACSYNDAIVTVNSGIPFYTIYPESSIPNTNYIGGAESWQIFSNGSYMVRAAHSNSGLCPVTKKFEVNKIPSPISFSADVVSHVTVCNEANNGKIKISSISSNAVSPVRLELLDENNKIISNINSFNFNSSTVKYFDNLKVGNYKVKLIDKNNCSDTVSDKTISGTTNPFQIDEANVIITEPLCFNPDNGGSVRIKTKGEGSSSSYAKLSSSISWGNLFTGSAGKLFSNLICDTIGVSYSFFAMPSSIPQCADTVTVVLDKPKPFKITITVTQPSCENNMGVVTFSGASNYQRKSGNNWVTAANQISLPPGNYLFRGISDNGCYSKEYDVKIDEVPGITLTNIEINEPYCIGDFGNIRFKLNGCTSNIYSLSYNSNELSQTPHQENFYYSKSSENVFTIHNIIGASYGNLEHLSVKNGSHCNVSKYFDIPKPTPILIDVSVPVNYNGFDIQCYGGKTDVTVNISGGKPKEHGYTLENPFDQNVQDNSTYTFDSVYAYEYSLKATDENGCQQSKTFQITQPPQLSMSVVENSIKHPSCYKSSDGEVTFNVTGGVQPYIIWDSDNSIVKVVNQSGLTTIDNLFAKDGNYDWGFNIIDSNTCEKEESVPVTIINPAEMSIKPKPSVHPKCSGDKTGILSFTAEGRDNEPKYFELWLGDSLVYNISDTNNSVISFEGLGAGEYEIKFLDSTRICEVSLKQEITAPDSLSYTLSPKNIACKGDSSGEVEVEIMGGTKNYSINLIRGADTLAYETGIDSNSKKFSNLSPGKYSIALADLNGCPVYIPEISEVTIAEPEESLDIILNSNPVRCWGEDNGSITATARNGWGNYSFSINSANGGIVGDTVTFNNYPKNDYAVFVKDSLGCTISDTIAITQPEPLKTDTVFISNVRCFGGNDGEVRVVPIGGNGDYRFLFESVTVEDDTKTDLISGTYNISITDKLNCSFNTTVRVDQPAEFNLTKSLSNYTGYSVRCNGLSDSISLKLAGGTAPYSYTLTHSGLNEIFDSRTNLQSNIFTANNLVAGNYILEFTDSHNCPYTEMVELTQPDELQFSSIDLIQPKCHNGSNGHIEITGMIGGVSVYDFSLSAFSSSHTESILGLTAKFINLHSDSIAISVTDSNECLTDTTLFLGQPDPIVPKFVIEPVTCKGDSNGSIGVELTGGNGLYNPRWFSSSNVMISTNLGIQSKPAGDFFFEAEDSYGCTAKNSEENSERFKVTIPEPDSHLSISGFSITEPSCYGFGNGSITLSSSGGWSKHEYSITSSSSGYSIDSNFNNLESGNYTVWLRDSIGCVIYADIEVDQPDSLKLTTNLVEDVSCFGESSGIVELSATGGNSGYNFLRSTGDSNQNGYFSSLPAGLHSFSVTDSKGCEDFIDVEINQPSQIVYTITKLVQPICGGNQGELEILPNGGTNPYQIEWANQSLPGTFSLSNLTSGSYAFTLRDSKGCSRTFTELLNDIDGPSVQLANIINPSCDYRNDGSIQVAITGGTQPHTVSWVNENQTWQGTETIQNLPKGNYTVKVTDSNGCLASKSISLNAPQALSFAVSTNPVSCWGTSTGSVSVVPQGGTPSYSLGWYSKNHEKLGIGEAIEGLPAGNYFMSIKDKNLCGITSDSDTLSQAISVFQPQFALQATIDKIIEPSCSGGDNGQITLKASGGWGDYRFSLDSLNFSANPVFGNQKAGLGKGYITDKQNCISAIDFNISEPQPITYSAIDIKDARCYGEASGTVKVSFNGGTPPYSYSINNGTTWTNQNAFFGLLLGDYSVTVKDKNSCLGLLNFSIGEPNELIADVSSVTSTYCGTANGEISLTAVGGTSPYTVDWSHLDKPWGLTATKLQKGSYSATIYDSNLCEANVTVEMPELDGPKIHNFSVLEPLCNSSSDGQIEISFSGISEPYSFYLNGTQIDSTFVQGLSKGQYIFTVADRFNCLDFVNISLKAPDPISIDFPVVTNPQCYGYSNGSITSAVTGGTQPYSYSWSNNQKVSALQNIPAGNYQLTVTDDHNCAQSATVAIYDPEQMTTDLPNEVALCVDQTVTLDAQNPGCQYWWTSENGFQSNERFVTLVQGGLYYLQVTNSKGCFANDTVLVKKFNHTVSATLLVPSTAHIGDTVVVVDISWPIPDSLLWYIPSEFTLIYDSPYEKHIKPKQEGQFDIELVTFIGECSAFNQKSIEVNEQTSPQQQKMETTEIIRSVSLAPNPASYSTRIGVELAVEQEIRVEIFNGFGVKVFGKGLSGSATYSLHVALNGLPRGMYLVKVTAAGRYRTVRLMVE